jgi:hypothetical protein
MLSLLLGVQNLQGLFNEYNAVKIDNVRMLRIYSGRQVARRVNF